MAGSTPIQISSEQLSGSACVFLEGPTVIDLKVLAGQPASLEQAPGLSGRHGNHQSSASPLLRWSALPEPEAQQLCLPKLFSEVSLEPWPQGSLYKLENNESGRLESQKNRVEMGK